jgi:hypothetical protein
VQDIAWRVSGIHAQALGDSVLRTGAGGNKEEENKAFHENLRSGCMVQKAVMLTADQHERQIL